MTNQEWLIELEGPVRRISGGINAIGIMTMGLAQAADPYADGFHAVWNYLVDAERDLQTQLTACQNAETD
ncbi:hypothetical protein D7V91_02565 [bacterium 1xD42-67]|jgi:hypothetical protein|nr:hypothetical protein D7V91_02565 [bacterium 1xD42-67]